MGESGIEETSIIGEDRRSEKIKLRNALDGLSSAFGFMMSEIAAMTLITAELPH